MQHTGLAEGERGGVVADLVRASACFDAVEFDVFIIDERIKDAGRIRPAADAGDDGIGKATILCKALGSVNLYPNKPPLILR